MKQRLRANDISFRDKNRRDYRARTFFVLGILFVVLGITVLIVGTQKTKDSFSFLTGKLFSTRASVGDALSTTASVVGESKKSLITERDGLKEQVANLEAQLTTLTVLKDENEKLQEMVGRKGDVGEQILGRIIVKPNQSLYDTLIIDAGTASGIRVGARVFARGAVAIGTIIEATANTATVSLFTTGGQKTQAVLVGKDIFLDLIGRGGGTFEATLPRDIKVEKGTEIVLPEGSSVVAISEDSIVDPRDPFQKILFRSPVNLFELRFVGVQK